MFPQIEIYELKGFMPFWVRFFQKAKVYFLKKYAEIRVKLHNNNPRR